MDSLSKNFLGQYRWGLESGISTGERRTARRRYWLLLCTVRIKRRAYVGAARKKLVQWRCNTQRPVSRVGRSSWETTMQSRRSGGKWCEGYLQLGQRMLCFARGMGAAKDGSWCQCQRAQHGHPDGARARGTDHDSPRPAALGSCEQVPQAPIAAGTSACSSWASLRQACPRRGRAALRGCPGLHETAGRSTHHTLVAPNCAGWRQEMKGARCHAGPDG